MHETGLSKEAQAEYDKWDDPQYMSGFTAGCEATKRTEETLNHKIEDLEGLIETLEQRIAGRDETITYLRLPWYVKLWKKLPRISINIERGA